MVMMNEKKIVHSLILQCWAKEYIVIFKPLELSLNVIDVDLIDWFSSCIHHRVFQVHTCLNKCKNIVNSIVPNNLIYKSYIHPLWGESAYGMI